MKIYVVAEDAQPCLAHSPTALNELNLAVAPPFVGQMKKKLWILSFHTIRDRLGQKPSHATVSLTLLVSQNPPFHLNAVTVNAVKTE